MSKIRERQFSFDQELPPPVDGALSSYIVYTCKKEGSPHRYAGYVNAPDIDLALNYACEHYGQDEECVNIWIHDAKHLVETPVAESALDAPAECTDNDASSDPKWIVFTQRKRGDIHVEVGVTHAADANKALEKAVAQYGKGVVQVRAVPWDNIKSTSPSQLIWRTHDQTYRLARGYSKSVRAKWAAVRKTDDINEYTKDDIKTHF